MKINKIQNPIPAASKLIKAPPIDTVGLLGNLEDLSQWSDLNSVRKTWALIPFGESGQADPVRSRKLLDNRPIVKQFFTDFPGEVKHAVYSYIAPNGIIGLHRDTYNEHGKKRPKFEIFNTALRFHIPLITNDQSHYYSEGLFYQMKQGELWMINNHLVHGAVNNYSDKGRYHLIFDVMPNEDTMAILSNASYNLGIQDEVLFQRFEKYNEINTLE